MSARARSASGNSIDAATSDELADRVVELTQQVEVLRNVLDEIRDLVSWITKNGIPIVPAHSHWGVVKQMALDPCAPDWGDRLVIVRGSAGDGRGDDPAASVARETLAAVDRLVADADDVALKLRDMPLPDDVDSIDPPVPPPEELKLPPGKLLAEPGEQGRLF